MFSDFDVLPPSFNFNVVNEIQLNFSGGRDYDITIDDIKSLTKLFEIEGRAGVRGPGDYEFAIGLSGASADNTGTIDVEWTDGQPVNWSLEWIEGTGTANFTIGSETISFINNDQIDQVFNLFLINATAVTDSKVEAGSSIEFEIDNINGSPLATPYNISATSPSSGRDFQEFVTDVFVPPITNMSGTATISWPGSLDPTIDGRSRLAFKMKAYDPPVVSEPTDVTSVPEPSLIWGLMVLGIFPMIKGKK